MSVDFIKGMDVSTLLEVERCGAVFYADGRQGELLDIMKSAGVNMVRLRLWNDPFSESGESYGAGGNDLATTLEIARRATKKGMGVLLDFQYSDFWADPGKQIKPKAWKDFGVPELEEAVYDYTKEVIGIFRKEGIDLKIVQIGNEITNGLLWPEGRMPHYDHIARFVNAGIRGARCADRDAAIMLHLDNGGNNGLYRTWFDEYMKRGEDFQFIGLSYYPFWHGTLDDLAHNMNDLAERYHKDMIVVETSMGHTTEDYASCEKLAAGERKGCATKPALVSKVPYPMTPEGQAHFMRDLVRVIKSVPDGRGKGYCYWEPAWLPVPGSGWATPASLAYMNDPGPLGNEWANQALFDYHGKALPALFV